MVYLASVFPSHDSFFFCVSLKFVACGIFLALFLLLKFLHKTIDSSILNVLEVAHLETKLESFKHP